MHAGHDEHFALTCLQSLVSCYTESSMTYNETLWIETTFRVAENKRLLWMYQTISWIKKIKKVKFDHRRPMVSDFALPFSFLLSQNVTKRLPCACKFCLRHWLWCYVVAKAINNNKPPNKHYIVYSMLLLWHEKEDKCLRYSTTGYYFRCVLCYRAHPVSYLRKGLGTCLWANHAPIENSTRLKIRLHFWRKLLLYPKNGIRYTILTDTSSIQ